MSVVGRPTRAKRLRFREEARDLRITLRLTPQEHGQLLEEAGTRDISAHARYRLFNKNPPLDIIKIERCRQALVVLENGFDLLIQIEDYLARGGRADDDIILVALQQTYDCLDETRLALVVEAVRP